jgi:D-galactarolactone cycloisomerase
MNLITKLPKIKLVKVEAFVYRVPIEEPVQTSFGIMHDRPAVLVRVEDDLGGVGWGEIWCNFPSVGAEHRARILESVIAPILLEKIWESPEQSFHELTKRLHILGIQSGEAGPISQAIAGADIAIWDLLGKKMREPLWRLFGGTNTIQTYASGLSPTEPEKLAAAKLIEGFRAFKLKVGFGVERDISNLRALRQLLGPDTALMIDANQAWTPKVAAAMSQRFEEFRLDWLEEPIPADSSIEDWRWLADNCELSLAAGENMRGEKQFTEAINSDAFKVIQPDVGKWGGISGCLPVARKAIAKGRLFCPHWLGGGIGLLASMHLKAAVGGPGYVEVDSNPNPLRQLLAEPYPEVHDGASTLPDQPGLGVEPNLADLRGYLVRHNFH